MKQQGQDQTADEEQRTQVFRQLTNNYDDVFDAVMATVEKVIGDEEERKRLNDSGGTAYDIVKKYTGEGVIIRQGSGRSTFYVRADSK